jgi:site-specific DNA-cytosine methylase
MKHGINKEVSFTLNTTDRHAVATTKGVGNIGSTTEGNAREILRKLWGEIGTEAFAEWGFGVLNILQPEEVLQSGLHGRTLGQNREAQEESQQACKAKQGNSTEDEREGAENNAMREMRGIIQKIRCTPQGQGYIQQFARELNDIMQELPQFNSPAKGEVPDMWRSGQGTRLLQQALSSLQEIRRPLLHQVQYAVRRLTPTEALRLQGFPDYWLDIEGMSDTARYKAVGNSVAIPCVMFVLGGIARVLRPEGRWER